jgi:hypothetical protein
MKAFAAAAGLALALLAWPATALADDGDAATISRPAAAAGEQVVLSVVVRTAPGAIVEVDPAAPSWNGVEFVRIASETTSVEGDAEVHRLELVVAPFWLGENTVLPAVNIVRGTEVTPRLLPAVAITVRATLAADAPLELSPLPAPEAIGGAESPLLRPGIAAGAVVGVIVAGFLGGWLVRAMLRRTAPESAPVLQPRRPAFGIADAEAMIDTDPVAAYRTLGTIVRSVIAGRYGFPAAALTTRELQGRMEAEGVDRWLARLVGGLLQECDAVVYAGYRPADERRQADLTMAHEILAGEA